jgi:periplasmic protein TonB
MKTKTLVLRHWEDVVFENRNQEYGAYVLRRAYSKRVILGWGITMALLAILLYFPNLIGVDRAEIIAPLIPKGPFIDLQPPPVFPKNLPKPVQPQQAQRSQSTQIVVTSDPVDAPVGPIDNVTASTDDTGAGGAIDGYPDGTSVEPIVEPVAPPSKTPIDIAEIMPRYDGGTEAMMKFIKKKIRIPNSFRYMTVGGTVFVRFVVRPDGKVTDVEVIKGLSKDCDKEAMRVISIMPGWIAGIQNGTSVPVRMVLPIKFAQSEY